MSILRLLLPAHATRVPEGCTALRDPPDRPDEDCDIVVLSSLIYFRQSPLL
jgi:hypothetical protein